MIRSAHIAILISIGYAFSLPAVLIWGVAGVLAGIAVLQRLSGKVPPPDIDCREDERVYSVHRKAPSRLPSKAPERIV